MAYLGCNLFGLTTPHFENSNFYVNENFDNGRKGVQTALTSYLKVQLTNNVWVSSKLEVKVNCDNSFFFLSIEKFRKMDSDEAVVKKLRNDFPDQFTSLVKMHLSFCLDQSTDE
jgi:hypothetical protein